MCQTQTQGLKDSDVLNFNLDNLDTRKLTWATQSQCSIG